MFTWKLTTKFITLANQNSSRWKVRENATDCGLVSFWLAEKVARVFWANDNKREITLGSYLKHLTKQTINVLSNTSSKFVMTDGLLLESVKLETGVFSASLLTLVTAVPAAVVGVVDTVVTCAAVDVTLAVLEITLDVLTALVGIFFRISSFAFHPSCKIIFISFIMQPYL